MLTDIMLGPVITSNDARDSRPVASGEAVFKMLDEGYRDFKSKHAVERVKRKLLGYFSKAHRWNALDAGTTTAEGARSLADRAVLPERHSPLSSLVILTNCTRVASKLELPNVQVRVVLLGGELRKSTISCAGARTSTWKTAGWLSLARAVTATAASSMPWATPPVTKSCGPSSSAPTRLPISPSGTRRLRSTY